MHTGPIPESDGTLTPADAKLWPCRKCRQQAATCEKWESSDGAFTDYKYTCTKCGSTCHSASTVNVCPTCQEPKLKEVEGGKTH